MKMLNAVLMITLVLISGVALAEKGAAEDSRVVYSESKSPQQGSGTRSLSPSELRVRNP
ncbi:hypothetical protein [Halomonas sp. HAL1]|uniref:hypothetical protein n=1 Tax=Halomonas sp. HAL1 TaxID=550984 RepID=UPI00022D2F3E|nr:hypothetical protein [Halomonas sp. HAL1]EHA16815.1 hypothetical protein HAL1_03542 [Halomonas sp. HAL1]WKV94643.1 hypothetical protein Q3Y66_08475 [Halomonas sp. HAL1]